MHLQKSWSLGLPPLALTKVRPLRFVATHSFTRSPPYLCHTSTGFWASGKPQVINCNSCQEKKLLTHQTTRSSRERAAKHKSCKEKQLSPTSCIITDNAGKDDHVHTTSLVLHTDLGEPGAFHTTIILLVFPLSLGLLPQLWLKLRSLKFWKIFPPDGTSRSPYPPDFLTLLASHFLSLPEVLTQEAASFIMIINYCNASTGMLS